MWSKECKPILMTETLLLRERRFYLVYKMPLSVWGVKIKFFSALIGFHINQTTMLSHGVTKE